MKPQQPRMNIHPIFKKKRFWIGVVLLFLFAFIYDIAIGMFILTKSLSSGQWSTMLLGLGLLYVTFVLYQSYLPKDEQKKGKWFGRILLLVIAVSTFQEHGYFKMIYFLATIFIFARFTRWALWLVMKKIAFAFKFR